MTKLRSIEGGSKPKPHAKQDKDDIEPFMCRICEMDIGIPSIMTMKVRIGGFINEKGKMTGGEMSEVCACCAARGKVTEV